MSGYEGRRTHTMEYAVGIKPSKSCIIEVVAMTIIRGKPRKGMENYTKHKSIGLLPPKSSSRQSSKCAMGLFHRKGEF